MDTPTKTKWLDQIAQFEAALKTTEYYELEKETEPFARQLHRQKSMQIAGIKFLQSRGLQAKLNEETLRTEWNREPEALEALLIQAFGGLQDKNGNQNWDDLVAPIDDPEVLEALVNPAHGELRHALLADVASNPHTPETAIEKIFEAIQKFGGASRGDGCYPIEAIALNENLSMDHAIRILNGSPHTAKSNLTYGKKNNFDAYLLKQAHSHVLNGKSSVFDGILTNARETREADSEKVKATYKALVAENQLFWTDEAGEKQSSKNPTKKGRSTTQEDGPSMN